ncbi:MAG: LapA family protein [Bdellovibrionales bacterium]|nr:LapA family protein [Bdellovibrionales bacterium]
MKGLKIIPMFLVLMALTYAGMLFVQANSEEVIVRLGLSQSPPLAIGFVVLTSIFIGMLVCGTLCSVEMLALYVQNRKLKKKIINLGAPAKVGTASVVGDVVTPKTSGRFT